MREVISLHVGQAGCQLGNSCWELFCLEHGIDSSGNAELRQVNTAGPSESFFLEVKSGKHVPRAVFIDMEPCVVDQIRTGEYRELYHPNQMICGQEDAADNFARGYWRSRDIMEQVMERIRKEVEASFSVQGFQLFHSCGGGTGSGLAAVLSEKVKAEFPKTPFLEFGVYPSPAGYGGPLEAYNVVLGTHKLLEHADCSFLLDNQSIWEICRRSLRIEQPSFANANRIIAQAVSAITASLRFGGELNVDLAEFHTNLVPFPRVHFPVTSYAPLVSASAVRHDLLSMSELTDSCFEEENQLISAHTGSGAYMACCLLYRGSVPSRDMSTVISSLERRRKTRFVDWSPTGFKVGMNREPPTTVPGGDLAAIDFAACMLANSTSVKELWARNNLKFDKQYRRRAFIHWFVGEGLEEGEFIEAREDMAQLERDYIECASSSAGCNDEADTDSSSNFSEEI